MPPYRMGLARALATAAKRGTVTTTTRSPNRSEQCDLVARSGDVRAEDGVRAAEGAYTLTLPPDSALTLAPEEEVRIDIAPGRLFRVVWTPPPTADDASRVYGLDEVGR